MNIFTKKLTVPESNNTKDIDVAQLWEVRWWSRKGSTLCDNDRPPEYVNCKPEVEVFLSQQEATDFKESLENAFALLRYSGTGIQITVKKDISK